MQFWSNLSKITPSQKTADTLLKVKNEKNKQQTYEKSSTVYWWLRNDICSRS